MAAITKNEAKKFSEDNSYNVEQFLGEGGWGVVFKCRNPKKDLVAVKVVKGDTSFINEEKK